MKKGGKKETGLSAQNGPVFKEQRENREDSCKGSSGAKDLNLCITPKNRNIMNRKKTRQYNNLWQRRFLS